MELSSSIWGDAEKSIIHNFRCQAEAARAELDVTGQEVGHFVFKGHRKTAPMWLDHQKGLLNSERGFSWRLARFHKLV